MQVLVEYLDIKPEQERAVRLLPQCLAAAEEFLDDYCKRQFMPEPAAPTGAGTPVLKSFPTRLGKWRYRIPDLRAAATVTLGGAALLPNVYYGGYELDDYDKWPAKTLRTSQAAVSNLLVGSRLEVTGWWGWWPIPAPINDAVYRLAARMYHERDATYSDALLLPEGGVLQYFRQMPATVQAGVNAYQEINIGSVSSGGRR